MSSVTILHILDYSSSTELRVRPDSFKCTQLMNGRGLVTYTVTLLHVKSSRAVKIVLNLLQQLFQSKVNYKHQRTVNDIFAR